MNTSAVAPLEIPRASSVSSHDEIKTDMLLIIFHITLYRDECVWFAIQKGLDASRSKICYFKHNDMNDLERQLLEASEKKELNSRRRAFLIVEAIYLNTGKMCPLVRAVELARKFKLRIILDESLSIGVSSIS